MSLLYVLVPWSRKAFRLNHFKVEDEAAVPVAKFRDAHPWRMRRRSPISWSSTRLPQCMHNVTRKLLLSEGGQGTPQKMGKSTFYNA